jgi:hypothetical protein
MPLLLQVLGLIAVMGRMLRHILRVLISYAFRLHPVSCSTSLS